MPRMPSLNSVDKALAGAATLAAKSAKLSSLEKTELRKLAQKASRQGLTTTDRARCLWLLRKAGPETLPNVPDWLRRLLRRRQQDRDKRPLRSPSTVDPLDRLKKLQDLRANGILTETQFHTQRARILGDPAIATFDSGDGVDPLDRLRKLGDLQAAGVITGDQASAVTSKILDDEA